VSFADQLLILWWVALPFVSLGSFLFLRWLHRREKALDERAVMRGELTTGLSPLRSPKGPMIFALRALMAAAIGILALFSLFIFWNGSETQLYFLSAQALIAAFGAAALVFPVRNPSFRSYRPKPNSWGAAALRVSFALVGLFSLVFFGYRTIGDVFSRQAVEGRVDNTWVERGTGKEFFVVLGYHVVIDGQRFRVTNEVYSELKVGDHIRAEVGRGSHTIFRAEVIPAPAR
jgi:hypothetical protein